MRLLNIQTREFAEFYGDNTPPYVVTSHRWTEDEVSHKDFLKKRKPESKGAKKVDGFCSFINRGNEFMRRQNPEYLPSEWVWIDTCCIDKRSSAEVSESINSMFEWYSHALECIAYLADVRPLSAGSEAVLDDFKRSEWFTRGWTLQELLAPPCVVFLTRDWEVMGHKCSFCRSNKLLCAGAGPLLNQTIAEVTGINTNVLLDYNKAAQLSIDEKLKWMENRVTTKTEDMAYCLLGIFDVNMPLLYGEGYKSLIRLGKELNMELREDSRSPRRPGGDASQVSRRHTGDGFSQSSGSSSKPATERDMYDLQPLHKVTSEGSGASLSPHLRHSEMHSTERRMTNLLRRMQQHRRSDAPRVSSRLVAEPP